MSWLQFLLCTSCVIAISGGQLLFKRAGLLLTSENGWANTPVIMTIALAGLIYGSATLLWIYLLKDIPLSKAYMIMALSFVLVPLASIHFYSEQVSTEYVIGSAFILCGLVIIFRGDTLLK